MEIEQRRRHAVWLPEDPSEDTEQHCCTLPPTTGGIGTANCVAENNDGIPMVVAKAETTTTEEDDGGMCWKRSKTKKKKHLNKLLAMAIQHDQKCPLGNEQQQPEQRMELEMRKQQQQLVRNRKRAEERIEAKKKTTKTNCLTMRHRQRIRCNVKKKKTNNVEEADGQMVAQFETTQTATTGDDVDQWGIGVLMMNGRTTTAVAFESANNNNLSADGTKFDGDYGIAETRKRRLHHHHCPQHDLPSLACPSLPLLPPPLPQIKSECQEPVENGIYDANEANATASDPMLSSTIQMFPSPVPSPPTLPPMSTAPGVRMPIRSGDDATVDDDADDCSSQHDACCCSPYDLFALNHKKHTHNNTGTDWDDVRQQWQQQHHPHCRRHKLCHHRHSPSLLAFLHEEEEEIPLEEEHNFLALCHGTHPERHHQQQQKQQKQRRYEFHVSRPKSIAHCNNTHSLPSLAFAASSSTSATSSSSPSLLLSSSRQEEQMFYYHDYPHHNHQYQQPHASDEDCMPSKLPLSACHHHHRHHFNNFPFKSQNSATIHCNGAADAATGFGTATLTPLLLFEQQEQRRCHQPDVTVDGWLRSSSIGRPTANNSGSSSANGTFASSPPFHPNVSPTAMSALPLPSSPSSSNDVVDMIMMEEELEDERQQQLFGTHSSDRHNFVPPQIACSFASPVLNDLFSVAGAAAITRPSTPLLSITTTAFGLSTSGLPPTAQQLQAPNVVNQNNNEQQKQQINLFAPNAIIADTRDANANNVFDNTMNATDAQWCDLFSTHIDNGTAAIGPVSIKYEYDNPVPLVVMPSQEMPFAAGFGTDYQQYFLQPEEQQQKNFSMCTQISYPGTNNNNNMPTFFAATDGNNGTQQIDMNLTQCQPMMMPHEQADHPMAVNMDGILKSSASINGTTGAGSFPLQLPFEGEQHEHADDQPKYNIYVEYGASSDRHARQQTTMALDNVSGINAFCDTAATVSAADAMAFAMANDGTHNENNNNGNAASEEVDEIDTLKLAQHISQELKRYSIPQAIFAQRVLCRSQGTLSDLLRNPKPWSKLKSGRETFRRMAKWLQEPELQRMSALRLAACKRKEELVRESIANTTGGNGGENDGDGMTGANGIECTGMVTPQHQNAHQQQQQQGHKKARLVFSEIQRRTLQAIFKETKRPSRELQIQIAQQLGLDTATVANYFMNARRRGHGIFNGGGSLGGSGGESISSGRTTGSGTPCSSAQGSPASTSFGSIGGTTGGSSRVVLIKLDDESTTTAMFGDNVTTNESAKNDESEFRDENGVVVHKEAEEPAFTAPVEEQEERKSTQDMNGNYSEMVAEFVPTPLAPRDFSILVMGSSSLME